MRGAKVMPGSWIRFLPVATKPLFMLPELVMILPTYVDGYSRPVFGSSALWLAEEQAPLPETAQPYWYNVTVWAGFHRPGSNVDICP